MEPALTILAGGFFLGLAGSLHCACMCGGIASGALFILNPVSLRQRMISLLLLQAGRITTYAIAGGLVASVASLTIDPELTAMSFRALQWLAALSLMWIGLSTAGMLPRLSFQISGQSYVSSLLEPVVSPLRRRPHVGPLVMGLSWGLTPCPMVYAALFTAALCGSAPLGALWMLGFGAGTLPGVIGSVLGISALSRVRRGRTAELMAGLLIAAFGFSTLYFNSSMLQLLCTTN